jgi:hypothetical protein
MEKLLEFCGVDSGGASGMVVVTMSGLYSGVAVGMACVDVDAILRYGGYGDSALLKEYCLSGG